MTSNPAHPRGRLFGLPADPRAIEEYEALDPARRVVFEQVAKAVERVARAQGAELRIDWWVDAEVEDWEELMLTAIPAIGTPNPLDLLGDLADVVHIMTTQQEPSLASWLNSSVGVTIARAA